MAALGRFMRVARGLELASEGVFVHQEKRLPACAVTGRGLLNLGPRRPRSKTLWAHETCHAHTRIGIDRSLARMHWFREIAASLEHRREHRQFIPFQDQKGREYAKGIKVARVSRQSVF